MEWGPENGHFSGLILVTDSMEPRQSGAGKLWRAEPGGHFVSSDVLLGGIFLKFCLLMKWQ